MRGLTAVCLVSVALGSSFAGRFREKDVGKRYAGVKSKLGFVGNDVRRGVIWSALGCL